MRHLITSGLPYINGIKHLGNLVGSMLPADVYARFLRQMGHEVLYVCGTDEHGAPAELAAEQAGEPVELYCDHVHQEQARIYESFDISFDIFGRTSSSATHERTRAIYALLAKNGFIERKSLKQYYSVIDGRFLADRYIIGTCPKCGYDRARGDQCEGCSSLLDAVELIEPRSAISGSKELELRETSHLFLSLDTLQARVETWVREQQHWPNLSKQIASKWLNEGLQKRCITRNLKWGVKVPEEGFEDAVFYVWFDAPIGYIGITEDWASSKSEGRSWKEFWLDKANVRYTQFMGKDNLPFHTVMFPAMLLGADDGWKLPDNIKGFHWLDYYGGKFSTSNKRGVFTDVALELYPADYWRYALMTMIPEGGDSTFTWKLFASTINKDLAQVLGNFVNRILKFTESKFGGLVPTVGIEGELELRLKANCERLVKEYINELTALEFRNALRSLRALWVLGNQYVDESAPWKEIKTDPSRAAVTVRSALNLIGLFGAASYAVMPKTGEQLLASVGLQHGARTPLHAYLSLDKVKPATPIANPGILFHQIEDETVVELEKRFGR
ncbi:MAG: methionine--tRNA ligase [Myxococcales bacterium]|nr:methionine--tRNA ligase [Myxococcales bacterium]